MANNVNNVITGVIDIPGALRSRGAADGNLVGGVVAYAGDIYDTTLLKNQSQINQEFSGSLSSLSSSRYITYSEGQGYALGNNTYADGDSSFAVGYSRAEGDYSHAEGDHTYAKGEASHAEGGGATAYGNLAHAEGYVTIASGVASHAEGYYTVTSNDGEHASGKYNKSTSNVTLFSVGIGTDQQHRTNAFEVTTDGKMYIKDIGEYNGNELTGKTDLATIITNVNTRLAALEGIEITAEDVSYDSSETYTSGTVGHAIQTGITASAASAAAAASSASTALGYISSLNTAMSQLANQQDVTAYVAANQANIAGLKSNIVVDLSVRYTTSYASLSAALTALNNDTATDAAAIKKGGVSIKFINSGTGKYEQWNLKASSWSTNISDWVLDVDGSIINGKLRLSSELVKPDNNTFATKTSEIGHNGQPLEQYLGDLHVIRNFFIDDASGDICFIDGNGNVVFRLSANGAEARQFRILNSSGGLVGTIDSAFLSAVLKSSDIIDGLTSSATNKPLSAKQGSVLKGLIDELMPSVSLLRMFIDDESGNTCFVDNRGDIVFRLSANGADMRKLNILNSDGSLVGSIDKDFFDYISSLEGLQSIAENIFVGDSGNTCFADERGNVAFSIDSNGTVNFKSFGQDLSRSLEQIIPSAGKTLIYCWGDSLTMGAGAQKTRNKSQVVASLVERGYEDIFTSVSNINYPIMIQLLLGSDNYNVVNCGIGGETINTIMARMGSSPAILPSDLTVPADTTAVLVANEWLLSANDRASSVKPLLQGVDNTVNPVCIEGIEGTLSRTFDSGYTNIKYYFTRSKAGRAATIPQYSKILMKGSSMSPLADVTIIWCWQNGGYNGNDDLIGKLYKCIRKLNNNNFIIIGLHTGTLSSRDSQEAALEAEFGDHFFNWRRYVSTNALYDFGITPTTDADFTQEQLEGGVKSDTYQMSIGALPSSLWASVKGVGTDTSNDYVHLNSAGYMILGYKLVERLKLLGAL